MYFPPTHRQGKKSHTQARKKVTHTGKEESHTHRQGRKSHTQARKKVTRTGKEESHAKLEKARFIYHSRYTRRDSEVLPVQPCIKYWFHDGSNWH